MKEETEVISNKLKWQRRQRRQFAETNGFSTRSNYSTGGMRESVLRRDGFKCVKCGMTDTEHKTRWKRPITIDHKDKNRANNGMDNLQTLCLVCHGRKDLLPSLREPKLPQFKAEIIAARLSGKTYSIIGRQFGFSASLVHKWCLRWGLPRTKSSRSQHE